MTIKAYKVLYERLALDYSRGVRDWTDFASAVSRLNQVYESSLGASDL